MNATKLRSYFEGKLESYLGLLKQMVDINSFTANSAGVIELGELTISSFQRLGFSPQRYPSGNPFYGDHLVLSKTARNGKARPSIGFVSHLDTVFPPDEEKRNDFSWRIEGDRIDQYNLGLGLSKTTVTGGTASLSTGVNRLLSSDDGQPLNPRASSSVDMSFTQPLLQGGGIRANLAPIEIARIDTERSFYQLKQSVQQLVRGVIEGYWALVLARVDVWARDQLTRRDRSIVVIAILTVLSKVDELAFHVPAGLNHGLSRTEIEEIMVQMTIYGGIPRAIEGARAMNEAFAKIDARG